VNLLHHFLGGGWGKLASPFFLLIIPPCRIGELLVGLSIPLLKRSLPMRLISTIWSASMLPYFISSSGNPSVSIFQEVFLCE